MRVEPTFERRRREREELLHHAREFVGAIERRRSVRAAVVFGSVARGDFNLWSDVDLLVVLEGVAELDPLQRQELLDERPARVQPIVWDATEWNHQLERRNPIATEALDSGVWLRGSARALRGRRPDPPGVAPDETGASSRP